ncbi:hypothetical protein EDM56_01415 [Brevibacillus fluminis]|uniref:Uncharacterized protein n=2 Tax=Brevibacillus fluminis TaxID=511487 RepID=A0A3M8DWS4_9BACL|nr:hypothetical protein EDM56_01415 [Brevibacillus fluminis]
MKENMHKVYLGFFLLLLAMAVILVIGLMIGKNGGSLPQMLGIAYGILFSFFVLYSCGWLPKRKKNKNHPQN